MTGALLPILSYGGSDAPPISVQATWHLNGDGTGMGVTPAYIANFTSDDEVIVASTSSSLSFTGVSPRSVAYAAGLSVPASNNPVIVMTLAGGPAASNPTSITFGGQAMTMRHMAVTDEGNGFHLTVAMLPMRGGLPASNTLTVTWPGANGFGLRARMILLSQVSADSDAFGTGYEPNTEEPNADGDFTLGIDTSLGAVLITGVYSNIPNSTTAPDDFNALGNSFLGDNPYNVAYLEIV
jgi:hypothetical protein